MDVLISVIVPVYNIKEYLSRCVASICAQTYRNLEIILVDDGSTDGTDKLCDELAATDGRIRVFHKENGGSSSARNLGIEKARGSYLGFVDSDDYIEPDMYERLLKVLTEHGVQMAQIGRDEIDANGKKLPNICEPPQTLLAYSREEFLRELLLHRGDCSFCTKLIARELFAEDRFPMGVLNEDFYLLIKLLPKVENIYSLPGYGYHVFYRLNSNTRKADKNEFSRVFTDIVDNADMVLSLVNEKYPSLQKEAVRFGLFQRLDYLLHIPISQMTRDNIFYRKVVAHIRKNWGRMVINPHLTFKNKVYLTLFAIAPKGIRIIHAKMKGQELCGNP